MSEQPKEVLLIYLPSIVHWLGYFTTVGLVYSLFGIAEWIVVLLCFFGFMILPPIFRIVKKGEEDLDE